MNNDPSSSSSSDPPPPPLDADLVSDETPLEEVAVSTGEDEQQRRKRVQREQGNVFLDHLIRNIDIMIYCQLSVLYYMEYAFPS